MSTIKLHRPGWTDHNWNPHGMFVPIRFDGDDNATIDERVFDDHVGDELARSMGIVVTRPKPKVEPTPVSKPVAKKAPAKKKPAKK